MLPCCTLYVRDKLQDEHHRFPQLALRCFFESFHYPDQSNGFSAASVLEANLKIFFQVPDRLRPESP